MTAMTTQLLSSSEFCKLRYDTIFIKSASANVSFYTNNSKMPNFELWHLSQMSNMFSLLLSMRISALFFTALLNTLKSLNWDDKHISESQRTTNCVYIWFFVNDQRTILFYVFISILYTFRAISCSSSGTFRPAHETVTDTEWHIPDVVLIKLILLMMRTRLLETCRELK
jgi:hypothetical protein